MEEQIVVIKDNEDYITLGVLLKITNTISTGGMAKIFLQEEKVKVNGVGENRRGRKLYPNDVIVINDKTFKITKNGN